MELEQQSLVQESLVRDRDLTVLRLRKQLKAAHKVTDPSTLLTAICFCCC